MENYIYLISDDKNRTYIGVTKNLEKRIKQHNGILSGGAKSTKSGTNWKYICILSAKTYNYALKIEWYWKHKKTASGKWKRTIGIEERLLRAEELCNEYDCIKQEKMMHNL